MENITLDKLPLNSSAKILNVNCTPSIKRRLLDLGLISGTNIKPILKNPMGDPIAYEIRGTTIAIRKEDSKLIDVAIM